MTSPKRLILAALFMVLRCGAQVQTPGELLQKGLYTQETAGDLDGALQIYRQVAAAAPAQSPVAAQAQFRIAEALLQKGDLNGAAAEFGILSSRYSMHQALIAKMAGGLREAQSQATGVVRDGRYRNGRTGVEFPVPSTWKVTYNGPSSGGGDMIGLSDGSSVDFGIWMAPGIWTEADITDRLRGAPAAKAKDRLPGFTYRPESVQNRSVAGHRAASAIADYVEGGNNMVECDAWIWTAKTHILFLARGIPVADLATAQAHLEQLMATTVVP